MEGVFISVHCPAVILISITGPQKETNQKKLHCQDRVNDDHARMMRSRANKNHTPFPVSLPVVCIIS